MRLASKVPSIPNIRPFLNTGGLFDIANGTYHIGRFGESILNGGLCHTMSFAGPGNSNKTTILAAIELFIADTIKQAEVGHYDSEGSLSYTRINKLAEPYPRMSQIIHGSDLLSDEEVKFTISSASDILGDKYIELIEDLAEERIKAKDARLTTPFIRLTGEPIKILPPSIVGIDSLSEFQVTSIKENILDKHNIGDSGTKIMYMNAGSAKKQLLSRLPNLTVQGGLYVMMSAHVGKEFDMSTGPVKISKHKLTHSKRGYEYKGVSQAFEYLNGVIYEIHSASRLDNETARTGVKYPLLECDRSENCVDLVLVKMKPSRNKSGQSGTGMEFVLSQRDGLLMGLSEYHYLKTNQSFGLVGGNIHASVFLPDVKVQRTTVREMSQTNHLFRRAMDFTSQSLQMKLMWPELPNNLWCDSETLVKDLTAMGYDMNTLLNTRGNWTFIENEPEELPYLSTMDLFRMRKELYHPYFLNEDRKTYNPKHKHLLTVGG